MDLSKLIKFAVDHGASDLHLQSAAAPMLRLDGQLRTVEGGPLSREELLGFLSTIAPQGHKNGDGVARAAMEGLDFSYVHPGTARFRCSAYCALGELGLTMRVIRTQIPTLEDLHLPSVIRDIALSQRGLTLLTGATGSGKSTTLAAMIDLINAADRCKIITIEDPVEYVHTSRKALISQIEVGFDTPSFDQALRQSLRQDPDVILIGEMRDVETLRMALRAADTGHQVFSTVHSTNAPLTIQRIIAMFPPAEHALLLSQLAHSIEAIISQRLIPAAGGKGRLPVLEILRGGPVTEKFILEGKLAELTEYVETGESGMQSFDQHLLQLYHEEKISGQEALRWASKPETFAMAMRGIARMGSGRKN